MVGVDMKDAQEQMRSFGKAIYYLIRPTWMLALSQLCLASFPLISFLTMSHTSYSNFLATGTGIVFCNFTGLSIVLALAVACEELSLNKETFQEAVVTLQKGLYMCLLIIPFLSWALWMNAGTVLNALGFKVGLSGLAEDFCFSFLPGFMLFVVCVFLQKYMYIVNMEQITPSLCCHFVAAVFHGILSSVFMTQTNLGARGAAYSLIVSYLVLSLMLFLCLMWQSEYRNAWPGWSWECVKDHWTYVKHVLPYIVVVALEWWTFDFGTFIVGALNEKDLPAQLIIVLLLEFLCLVTHQFSLAASGQILDAVKGGFWKRAVFILKCSMLLTWIFSILCGALLSGLRTYFIPVYTNNWRVTLSTAEIIVLITPIPFLRGTQALGFHVLRRFERRKLPVIISAVGYWGISLPLALILLYYAKRGIQGFWIGYTLGAACQAIVFLMLLYHKMRQWIAKQDMYTREIAEPKDPVTPSGQMPADPFLYEDVVDGKKRSSINIEHPRIHVPFNPTEMSTELEPSVNEQATEEEDTRPSVKILCLRTVIFMTCVCIFVLGIGLRFFVPCAHKGHKHDI